MNHRLLHQLSPAEVEYEVRESKQQIEDQLQQPCKVLAYPAGFFTERVRQSVRDAGYIAAFSTCYDSSFDVFWLESSVQWSCAVARESGILNWQYKQQPGKEFETLGLYENDKLSGYVVLFFRKVGPDGALPKAAITDLCYHPQRRDEIVSILLRGALQKAVERRAAALVTDVIDPLVEEHLKELGFWHIKSPLELMVSSPGHNGLLSKSRNWFLTRGDSDISIFEQSNL